MAWDHTNFVLSCRICPCLSLSLPQHTHTHTHTHTHMCPRPGVTGWNNRTHFWGNCSGCSADEIYCAENQTFFSFQQCPSLNSVWGRERSTVDKDIQLELWTLPSGSQALTMAKPLTVWSQEAVENSLRDGHTRPPDLPPEKYGQEATVRTGHGTTDWFQTGKGVHQGCILSCCLFNLYAEYIIGEGSGTPLQCSCLENLMDGGAW